MENFKNQRDTALLLAKIMSTPVNEKITACFTLNGQFAPENISTKDTHYSMK